MCVEACAVMYLRSTFLWIFFDPLYARLSVAEPLVCTRCLDEVARQVELRDMRRKDSVATVVLLRSGL